MDNKEKTLVILSPAFASDESDSKMPSQELLVRMFNRLFPHIKIVVLTFHFPIKKEREYEWHGNKVITLNGALKGGMHSPMLWIKAWKRLQQLHRTYHIVGLFSFFCSECAFVGHYFAKRHTLKHHIWVMGQDAKKENHQVRRIRPEANELVTISDFLQREFERNHGLQPKHVIPIGVDVSLFKPQPPHRNIDIMGAGSLIPLKQYDAFTHVVSMVAKSFPDLTAFIAGNGPEEINIRNNIHQLHLENNITLTGKKTHEETISMMQRSKLFLHTSSYEGLGVVCLEALYAGAQVISFCKPMNDDIPGWHIVNNKEEMARKAIEVFQQKTLEYKTALPYKMEDTATSIMNLFLNP